ncbi:MAG: NPCBM/NEW2 domain-containing protein, partial [Asticcacaulis sp.]
LAYRSGDADILVKTLSDGSKAVTLLNRGLQPIEASLSADQLKFDPKAPVTLTDLWSQETLAPFTGSTPFKLAPRESRVFIARGTHELQNGLYLSEMTGRINVAEDGTTLPEADPEMLHIGWGGTQGSGEWPSYPGWGGAQADASPYRTPLSVGFDRFRNGIGILSNSRMEVRADGGFSHFNAKVGVDNATRNRTAAVRFYVYGDGKLLAQSASLAFGGGTAAISADVSGVKVVELIVRSDDPSASPVAVTWGDAALVR